MGIPQSTKLAPRETLQYAPYDSNMDYCINYASSKSSGFTSKRVSLVKQAEGSLDVAKSGYSPQVVLLPAMSGKNGTWPGTDNSNWTAGFRCFHECL
jgi:hypothetical protein